MKQSLRPHIARKQHFLERGTSIMTNQTQKAYKKLGVNISLFSISSFGTKLISYFLVPLYTNCLSTAEYGTVDMLGVIVQLLVPVFTFDIADAVIRYTLDENESKAQIFLIGMKIIALGSTILVALLFAAKATGLLPISTGYCLFVFSSFFLTSIYTTMTNYFKGRDRVGDIVIAGLLCSLTNCLLNLVFLLKYKLGIPGYLYANLLSLFIPVVFLVVQAIRYGFLGYKNKLSIDRQLQAKMLKYSMPLIVNGLSWWINNSLDRFFVNSICGIEANGLLAVAYKIPSILSMFQTIFNQAWTMSAVQEFDPRDEKGFISNIYNSYSCEMSIACGGLLIMNIPLAILLYKKDFFVAWNYTGFLILSSLIGAMSICISGVFNAVKDSKSLGFSTLAGAIVNTALNATLIPVYGVTGAVLATLVSNVVIWIYRMIKVRQYATLKLNLRRDIIAYLLLLAMCACGLTETHLYPVQVVCMFIIILLYQSVLKGWLLTAKKWIMPAEKA